MRQTDFGELVGISQPAVSGLVSRGVLEVGGSAGEWLKAYCGHLREVAAGRASMEGGDLDLVQERAGLAREQRMGQAIKNAVARREYAPIEVLAKVLSDASAAVVERLEGMPARLRKEVPDLPPAAYDSIATVLATARNEWVRGTRRAVLQRAGQSAAELDGDADDEGGAAADTGTESGADLENNAA